MPNALLDGEQIADEMDEQLRESGYEPEENPYINALVTPTKDALSDLAEQSISYYNRGVLALASDIDLDEKTSEFGVQRGGIGAPFDDTFTNFHIFITSGKAKDYTLEVESDLVIPADAVVITDAEGIEYLIADAVSISPEGSTGFTPISSTSANVSSVAQDSIVNIEVDLTKVQNLNPAVADQIQFGCNNNSVIGVPNPISTDDELRDAAFLRINSMNNTNRDAIRLALNSYGITDITFKQDMFGVGTLGVLIKIGDSSRVSDTTIRTVNNILTNIVPFARVIEPEVLVVKFSARIAYEDDADIELAKADVLSTVQDYFSELDIGNAVDPIVIEELITDIESVVEFKINCMFIDDRPCLKARQPAMEDQIFSLDPEEPITYLA